MAHRRSISALPRTLRRKLSSIRASTQQHVDTSSHHQPVDTTSHHQPVDMTSHHQPVDTTPHRQAMTMETDNVTVTKHPSELLRQVAVSMNKRHEEILVTVPRMTPWKTVLHAVDSALGEVDGE
jgi:hypothetical protein